jgi:hypothetical protein
MVRGFNPGLIGGVAGGGRRPPALCALGHYVSALGPHEVAGDSEP